MFLSHQHTMQWTENFWSEPPFNYLARSYTPNVELVRLYLATHAQAKCLAPSNSCYKDLVTTTQTKDYLPRESSRENHSPTRAHLASQKRHFHPRAMTSLCKRSATSVEQSPLWQRPYTVPSRDSYLLLSVGIWRSNLLLFCKLSETLEQWNHECCDEKSTPTILNLSVSIYVCGQGSNPQLSPEPSAVPCHEELHGSLLQMAKHK